MRILLFFLLFLLTTEPTQSQDLGFPLPDIPQQLRSPEARADYLSQHYWDHFPTNDTALLTQKRLMEGAFSTFLTLMPLVKDHRAALDHFLNHMATNRTYYDRYVEIAESYLYDPYSPMYDEELYIVLLESLLAQDTYNELEKSYYRHQYSMAQINRLGSVVKGFRMYDTNGRKHHLKQLDSEWIVLLFGNLTCSGCNELKRQLSTDCALMERVKKGQLRLISIEMTGDSAEWRAKQQPEGWEAFAYAPPKQADEDYYAQLMSPMIYLLDASHHILLKTVRGDQIEPTIQAQLSLQEQTKHR